MNFEYIGHALGYHGQPLQKIWDDERGVDDLRKMGLTQVDYGVYQERQKYFTFQERAKRLKMHQFLARKATDLYDRLLVANVMEDSVLTQANNSSLVQQPPLEFFHSAKEKRKAWAHRLRALKQGGIIYTMVMKLAPGNRLVVKPLCTADPMHAYLADIPIKAIIMPDYWGPLPLDKQGNQRSFAVNDILRCEICSISADTERLNLNMIGLYNKALELKLGLCDISDLPKYYRNIHNQEHPSTVHYEDKLTEALQFQNPNYDLLFQLNGLQPNEHLSLMCHLKSGFPDAESAAELRQKQASQWAFRSVADGIEHFKNGQQVEAFQCLNKALNIDPRNVEGLVARGALYANRGSFLKGLQDFEKALHLNKYHVNARKYMGETLVALGRSYEEENRIPEAIKAYSDCLNLLPQHEEARQSLDALQRPPPAALVPSGSDDGKHRPSAEVINLTGGGQSSDESSSSSASESDCEDQAGKMKTNISQPFYAQSTIQPPGEEKLAVIDAQKANEFRLDEDETMSSVRKLLREASKHKKSKKKSKKKKDKKGRRSRTKSMTEDPMELLKKIDFQEAFRLVNSSGGEEELKAKIKHYFNQRDSEGDSPPPPPSMKKLSTREKRPHFDAVGPSTSRHAAAASASGRGAPPASKYQDQKKPPEPAPKLSFQIKKRPLQMDKFGLLRLATPAEPLRGGNSSSRSRSRSRSPRRSPRRRGRSSVRRKSHRRDSRSISRSRSRTRSRSRRRRSVSRSLSRSRSPGRYGNRFGKGSSRFVNRRNRRSRSRSFQRRRTPPHRRTPSPFVPRRTPSPASRYRRTRSRSRSRSRSYSPRRFPGRHTQRGRGRGRGWIRGKYSWYNHDRRSPSRTRESNGREEETRPEKTMEGERNADRQEANDEPTIEQVDEMIRDHQKERKQGIIEASKEVME